MKSLDTTELRKRLDHKAIIFDTNVLLESSKQTEAFAEIFTFIKDCKCQPQLFPLIEFEFFERIYQEELILEKREFLKALDIEELSLNPLTVFVERAIVLANIYASHGRKSLGCVDACIGALLEKFHGNLFLLTSNYTDFNQLLFDRLFLYPVSFGDTVLNLGFYEFNPEKLKEILVRKETRSKTGV